MFIALTTCESVIATREQCSLFSSPPSLFPFLTSPLVPSERVVINKERSSGSYHLSAYYLAKTFSELPLLLTLPSIYIVVVYWSAGLNGWGSFFGTWFVILCGGFTTQVAGWHMQWSINKVRESPSPSLPLPQSYGLFVSACVTATPTAIAIAAVSMLGSMLLGGFYVRSLPVWLKWTENLSFITYAYDAMLQLEFTEDSRFR